MAEIYDLDPVAANNNSSPPDGWPENMAYSEVNDTGREQMALLARFIRSIASNITTAGTSNAYTLTVPQTLSSYAAGQMFIFKADRANTGAATINVNSLGAAALVDQVGTALVSGQIVADGLYLVQYDGTSFQILTIPESASSIKTKYESNSDTNAFTDVDEAALNNLIADTTRLITSAETTASDDKYRVLLVSGTFDLTLLAAATAGNGYHVIVINIGTGVVTIARDSTDTIDGATSFSLIRGMSARFTVDNDLNAYHSSNVSLSTIREFEISAHQEGLIIPDIAVLRYKTTRRFTIPDDFAGSFAHCETGPSGGSVIYNVARNGSNFGTITFAAAATAGTFVTTSTTEAFAPSDELTVIAPADTRSMEDLFISITSNLDE